MCNKNPLCLAVYQTFDICKYIYKHCVQFSINHFIVQFCIKYSMSSHVSNVYCLALVLIIFCLLYQFVSISLSLIWYKTPKVQMRMRTLSRVSNTKHIMSIDVSNIFSLVWYQTFDVLLCIKHFMVSYVHAKYLKWQYAQLGINCM